MTAFVLGNSVAMRWLLARAYRLSSYDPAYLELALREGLPLATLDKDLLKAARKSDIEIYLKEAADLISLKIIKYSNPL